MIGRVWAALGGEAREADAVRVRRTAPILPSALPVGEFAIGCVASALLAAAELAHARGPEHVRALERPAVSLDADHVAASFISERHLRVAGRSPGPGFARLSTWLRTEDGWLRSHANYPRHRAALLSALGVSGDSGPEAVRVAAVRWRTDALEEAIFAAGGCAAGLRERSVWESHPQGQALAGRGLLDLDEGAAGAAPLRELEPREIPAAGIRVLDLTRVIAGPVAGRTLSALGAEVLRIDAPGSTELEISALDGGPSKRSALLDLRSREGAGTFHELLQQADVLIEGYRPGALESLGFGPRQLASRYPNLVTASLSAWGDFGPWGGRRGFDSLVQSASGIAVECTPLSADTPGALPAQALDHGTGHMIAAAILRGLAHRQRAGRAVHARFALARTAAFLLDQPRDQPLDQPRDQPLDQPLDRPRDGSPAAPPTTPDASAYLLELGGVTLVAPPGELDGRPLRWTSGPEPIGSSAARWN